MWEGGNTNCINAMVIGEEGTLCVFEVGESTLVLVPH